MFCNHGSMGGLVQNRQGNTVNNWVYDLHLILVEPKGWVSTFKNVPT